MTARLPRTSVWLGFGGVLPFALLALACWTDWPLAWVAPAEAFAAYSATILAFLGGIRWGLAANEPFSRPLHLSLSVAPALWAALCLLAPSATVAVGGLAVGFAGAGVADTIVAARIYPPWLRRLRAWLTALVLGLHVSVIAAPH